MQHTNALQEAPQEEEAKVDLSDFLLQDSPLKKRSFEDMVWKDNDKADDADVVEVLDFTEDNDTTTTLSAKVEKMSAADTSNKVSTRRKRKRT